MRFSSFLPSDRATHGFSARLGKAEKQSSPTPFNSARRQQSLREVVGAPLRLVLNPTGIFEDWERVRNHERTAVARRLMPL